MWFILWFGCSIKSDTADSKRAAPQTFLVDILKFARIEEETSWGFDVDGVDSDSEDAQGCFHRDWADPLGYTGIDNALGALAPILELTEAAAVESIIDEHIRNGTILLLLEWDADRLRILRGQDSPMTGTDGRFLDGQSLRYDPLVLVDITLSEQEQTWLGEDFGLVLQFSVLSNDIVFDLQQASLRIKKMEDGRLWGVLGGKVPMHHLLLIANDDQVGPNEFFVDVLSSAADIDPDETGQCQFISTAFVFEGVPVFLID